MSDVIVVFDTHGKFLGIAHDPRNSLQCPAVVMSYDCYEKFLQKIPRENRTMQDAINFGGITIKEITT